MLLQVKSYETNIDHEKLCSHGFYSNPIIIHLTDTATISRSEAHSSNDAPPTIVDDAEFDSLAGVPDEMSQKIEDNLIVTTPELDNSTEGIQFAVIIVGCNKK